MICEDGNCWATCWLPEGNAIQLFLNNFVQDTKFHGVEFSTCGSVTEFQVLGLCGFQSWRVLLETMWEANVSPGAPVSVLWESLVVRHEGNGRLRSDLSLSRRACRTNHSVGICMCLCLYSHERASHSQGSLERREARGRPPWDRDNGEAPTLVSRSPKIGQDRGKCIVIAKCPRQPVGWEDN